MEFAASYYAVALPILMAGIWRFADALRWVFAVSFVLAAGHFAMVAGWTLFAIFGAAVIVSWLLVVLLQRGQAVGVLYPAVSMVVLVAILMGGAQIFHQPSTQPNDATSLPYLKRPNVVSSKQRKERMVRNPVFAIGRTESMIDHEMHEFLLGQDKTLASQKPAFGHGSAAWWTLQTKTFDADHPFVADLFEVYPAFRSTHNGYSKLLVEFGAVGLCLFLLWVLGILVSSLTALKEARERPEWMLEHWALMTAFLSGLAFMSFTPMLEQAPGTLVWAVSAALSLRLAGVVCGFTGSTAVWTAESSGRVIGASLVAAVIGAGMLTPTVMSGVAERHRGAADQYMLRTKFGDAITHYQAAEEWYPAYGDIAYNIALAARRLGELEQLHSYVEYAMELRPYDVRVLNLQGHVYLQEQEQIKALGIGRRAVDAMPNSERANKLVISSLDLLERFGQAVEHANAYIERDPPGEVKLNLYMVVGDFNYDILKRYGPAKEAYQNAFVCYRPGTERNKLHEKIDARHEAREPAPDERGQAADPG